MQRTRAQALLTLSNKIHSQTKAINTVNRFMHACKIYLKIVSFIENILLEFFNYKTRMKKNVNDKRILNQLSHFWFRYLK